MSQLRLSAGRAVRGATSAVALAALLALARRAEAADLYECPPGATDTIVDPFISNLDDGSYLVPAAVVGQVFPQGIPFIQTYSDVWININGNLSFGQSVSTFTPDAIPGLTIPTIAAYFGDVDVRPVIGDIHLCVDTAGGRLMVTWDSVGYYDQKTDKLNSFQVILTHNDSSVCAAAPTFGVEFRYNQLQWTTGDASGGTAGLGGTPATAGIDAGNTIDAVALPGSHTGAVLDLVNLTNKNEPGAFQFLVAAGKLPTCGNNTLELCETCDDGNSDPNDACTNLCLPNVCGDGFVYLGVEDCDGTELGAPTCPPGTTGSPLCNNDPANPNADGTCTFSFPPAGCTDIDECADAQQNDCDVNADCTNTVGSFTCACKPGFAGDGVTCSDVNECANAALNNCDAHATCSNTTGGYICTCDPGYYGDGFTCLIFDTDGDGLGDLQEQTIGTDPNDADSDDDGVLDGQEPQAGFDSDGDGTINALDPDSDNDGLFDGTEIGLDCSHPDTDTSAGNCVPDADMGATTTNPIDADTDNGGALDGSEDWNGNGQVDAGETDPQSGSGDDASLVDTDGDGASDALEQQAGTNPTDADSDDDGVLDGIEVNPTQDTDGDGLINMLDPDSDNDGLFDGTELGKNCELGDTDAAAGHCVPDADPSTKTSPVNADTDGGGAEDGAEDINHNGLLDPGELNPTTGHADDDMNVIDTDEDGLSDGEEIQIGTDPTNADSDNDGVLDGDEANPTADDDGDGLINVSDADSDNDGLFDGTELGLGCTMAGATCVPDADGGTTQTGALTPDSDGGGVKDGVEDKNGNGQVDPGETDPNDPNDDVCTQSSECALEGQVCDPTTSQCIDALCDQSLQCPLPDACHLAGVCEPAAGTCSYANAPDGTSCDDKNPCTEDKCASGTCDTTSKLDGTPCTKNDQAGQCIAGECLTDTPGDGGAAGSASGGNGAGGSGNGTGAGTGGNGGGDGGGGSGNGGNPEGGSGDGTYSIFGGACSTSERSGGAPLGMLIGLGMALAALRRRRG